MSCPFCTLPEDRILLADPLAVVVHDAYPVSPGHTLIIPRRHLASFFDVTEAERQSLFALLDRGMMSVSDSFTVLLSRNISLATNAAGLLGVLEGRNFVVPNDGELWPLPKSLAWHRREHGYR